MMKNGTAHPTRFWAEEFITPHQMFTAAGFEVHLATPGGVTPTVDPLSLSLGYNNNDQGSVDAQLAYLTQMEGALGTTVKLADADSAAYDVVFVVGGHGPMQDLAIDPTIGTFLASLLDNPTKIVAAVCYGPASFLSAHRADGTWLFTGRELIGSRASSRSPQESPPTRCSGSSRSWPKPRWRLTCQPPSSGSRIPARTSLAVLSQWSAAPIRATTGCPFTISVPFKGTVAQGILL